MGSEEWGAEYYETSDGEPIIEDEMRAFGAKVFARFLRTVDLLEEKGLGLGGSYVGHIKGKIWELRVSRYRILYFAFTGRRFVLLRAFIKKTQKTPKQEIKTAERRLTDYVERMTPENVP